MKNPIYSLLALLGGTFVQTTYAQVPLPNNKPPTQPGIVHSTLELPTGITLNRNWQSRLGLDGGGLEMTKLLAGRAQPSIDGENPKDLPIYHGVKWLMPFDDAIKEIGSKQKFTSLSRLPSTVLPQGSFSFVSIDGRYEDGFSHLMIVVDSARNVVCMQLEDNAPKSGGATGSSGFPSRPRFTQAHPKSGGATGSSGWGYYNYLRMSRKATSRLQVNHDLKVEVEQPALFISGLSPSQMFHEVRSDR